MFSRKAKQKRKAAKLQTAAEALREACSSGSTENGSPSPTTQQEQQQQTQQLSTIQSILTQYPEVAKIPNKRGDLPLHLACQQCGASLKVVEVLVQAYPSGVRVQDDQGSLPLHWACFAKASLLVIQNLILQYPESVSVQTANGQMALHYACHDANGDTIVVAGSFTGRAGRAASRSSSLSSSSSITGSALLSTYSALDIIKYLVKKNPSALEHANTHGLLPLHIACSSPNVSLDVVQYLVQQYPSALGITTSTTAGSGGGKQDDGQLPVDRAIACGASALVVDYLQNAASGGANGARKTSIVSSKAAAAAVESAKPTTTPAPVPPPQSTRTLPPPAALSDSITSEAQLLHACSDASVTVAQLQSILQHDPRAIMARTQKGMRPLHICCWKGASVDVVEFLVQQWPESIKARTTREWIPLHVACASDGGGSGSAGTLASSTTGSLRALQSARDNQDAASNDADADNQLQVVQCLVGHWKESVRARDNKERIPLHICCFSGAPLSVVQYLVSEWPDSVMAMNNYGSLPLHLACGTKSPLPVIQYLVQCKPESLRAVDSEGRTPLELAYHPLLHQHDGDSGPQPDDATVAWLEAVLDSMDRKEKKKQGHFEKDRTKLAEVLSGARDKPVSLSIKYVQHMMQQGREETQVGGKGGAKDSSSTAILGQGHFGVVFMGTDTVLKRNFAIKSINRALLVGGSKDDLERVKKDFKREQKGLLRFRHPNVALLYGYCLSDSQRKGEYLVYQLAEKGSLDQFWSSQLGRERLASFGRRAQIALETFIGLRFLHIGNKYLTPCFHRDIKSANIVLKRDMTAQLIDCGMATLAQVDGDRMRMSTGVKGTRGYVCPKYCTGSIPYDASCDIFSFGIVLAELWSGQLQNHRDANGRVYNYFEQYINEGRSMDDDLDNAFGLGIGDKMPHVMNEYKNLALDCMAKSPKRRPSGEDVMDRLEIIWHSFENDLEDETETDADESQDVPEDDSRESGDEPVDSGVQVAISDETLDVYESDTSRGSRSDSAESADSAANGKDSVNAVVATDPAAANAQERLVSPTESVVDAAACSLCRTYATDDFVDECLMCLALQQKRDVIAKTVSSELNADSSLVQSFEYTPHVEPSDEDVLSPQIDLRLNNPVPRLFAIVPEALKHGWKHPKTWLRRKVATKYNLFFICGHTYQVVRPPIKLIVSSEWIEKIAISLALSLTLLLTAATKMDELYGPAGGSSSFTSPQLKEMLQEVEHMIKEQGNGGLEIVDRIRSGIRLSDKDVALLNGETYALIVEKAREDREWRNVMEPARKRDDPHITWVSRIVCMDPESNYENVNV